MYWFLYEWFPAHFWVIAKMAWPIVSLLIVLVPAYLGVAKITGSEKGQVEAKGMLYLIIATIFAVNMLEPIGFHALLKSWMLPVNYAVYEAPYVSYSEESGVVSWRVDTTPVVIWLSIETGADKNLTKVFPGTTRSYTIAEALRHTVKSVRVTYATGTGPSADGYWTKE